MVRVADRTEPYDQQIWLVERGQCSEQFSHLLACEDDVKRVPGARGSLGSRGWGVRLDRGASRRATPFVDGPEPSGGDDDRDVLVPQFGIPDERVLKGVAVAETRELDVPARTPLVEAPFLVGCHIVVAHYGFCVERPAGAPKGDSTMSYDVQTRPARLDALAPFLSAFERASEQMVSVLIDLVAEAFARRAESLQRAAQDQSDVLDAIARMIGMDAGKLDRPLDDSEGEARVQREARRTASTWATLTLLWALADCRGSAWTHDEWASSARDRELHPPGGSSLGPDDERLALTFAAEALAGAEPFRHGRSLFLQAVSVFVSSDGAAVTAVPVGPAVLVHKRTPEGQPPALTAGDDVWFADAGGSAPVSGPFRETEPGRVTMIGPGTVTVTVAEGLRLTTVTEGVWCYCSGI